MNAVKLALAVAGYNSQTGTARKDGIAIAVAGLRLPVWGIDPPHVDTASGDSVHIEGAKATALVGCSAGIVLTQEGSGTPSTDNVRSIIGRNTVNVIVSTTQDAQDGTVFPISLGDRVVCSGSVDIANGSLSVTHKLVTFNGGESEIWSVPSGVSGVMGTIAEGAVSTTGSDNVSVVADYLPSEMRSAIYAGSVQDGICLYNGNRIWLRKSGITTADAWREYLAEHPLTVAYKLATSESYTITPAIVRILRNCYVWADSGPIAVSYWTR